MGAITKGIYDTMANDPVLQSLLGTYYGEPCIFTISPVPTDAPFPLIDASNEITFVPFDTKVTTGVDTIRELNVFVEASGTTVLLEEISDRVREIFHRQTANVNIVGYDTVIVDMQEGPRFTTEDNRIYGKEFELRIVLQKCP